MSMRTVNHPDDKHNPEFSPPVTGKSHKYDLPPDFSFPDPDDIFPRELTPRQQRKVLFVDAMAWFGLPKNWTRSLDQDAVYKYVRLKAASPTRRFDLSDRTLRSIANRVSKYCFENLQDGSTREGLYRIQADRGRLSGIKRRQGTPLQHDDAPWIAAGVSKATWYRHRKGEHTGPMGRPRKQKLETKVETEPKSPPLERGENEKLRLNQSLKQQVSNKTLLGRGGNGYNGQVDGIQDPSLAVPSPCSPPFFPSPYPPAPIRPFSPGVCSLGCSGFDSTPRF